MNLSKLEKDKRDLCQGVLKKIIEEKYEKPVLGYVGDFIRENGINADFEILLLLDENGSSSGIGKCTACATKFQV